MAEQNTVDPLGSMFDALGSLQRLRHAEEKHQVGIQTQKATQVLDLAHAQEAHSMSLGAEAKMSQLDADQKKQDMELKLAQAAAKGAVPPSMLQQEPVVPPQEPEKNPASALNDILAAARKAKETQDGPKTPANQAADYLAEQILKTAKQVEDSKSLKGSGFIGKLLGGTLNALVPGVDLGTSVFGSKLSAEEKLKMYTSALYTVSPLVRTEMADALGDRKQDWQERMKGAGLTSLSPFIRSATDLNNVANVGFDLDNQLANNAELAPVWGSNSESGARVDSVVNAYKNMVAAQETIQSTTDETAIKEAYRTLQDSQETLKVAMESLAESGMSPEQLQAALAKAQEVINKSDYMQPIKPVGPGGNMSKDTYNILTQQQAAAAHEIKILGQLGSEGIPYYSELFGKRMERLATVKKNITIRQKTALIEQSAPVGGRDLAKAKDESSKIALYGDRQNGPKNFTTRFKEAVSKVAPVKDGYVDIADVKRLTGKTVGQIEEYATKLAKERGTYDMWAVGPGAPKDILLRKYKGSFKGGYPEHSKLDPYFTSGVSVAVLERMLVDTPELMKKVGL